MRSAAPWMIAAGGLGVLLIALASPRAEARIEVPSRRAPPDPTPAPSAHAPLPGHPRVGSGFGVRKDPFTGQPAFHRGLDIPVPVGTPVYAPFAGRVERIDRAGIGRGVTNGNAIFLRSGAHLWAFLHLATVEAPVGAMVQRGQLIGRTGATGRTTGPHLHIQVYDQHGQLVDPMKVYPQGTFVRRGA